MISEDTPLQGFCPMLLLFRVDLLKLHSFQQAWVELSWTLVFIVNTHINPSEVGLPGFLFEILAERILPQNIHGMLKKTRNEKWSPLSSYWTPLRENRSDPQGNESTQQTGFIMFAMWSISDNWRAKMPKDMLTNKFARNKWNAFMTNIEIH